MKSIELKVSSRLLKRVRSRWRLPHLAMFVCVFLVEFISSSYGTTIRYVSLPESIRLSDLILIGTVIHIDAAYDKSGETVTNVTIKVEECLKGNISPGLEFRLQSWGGEIDGIRSYVVGEVEYSLGERILVQLENIEGSFHTLGLSFGKWDILIDTSGQEILRRDLSGLGLEATNVSKERQLENAQVPLRQLLLEEMRRTIRQQATMR